MFDSLMNPLPVSTLGQIGRENVSYDDVITFMVEQVDLQSDLAQKMVPSGDVGRDLPCHLYPIDTREMIGDWATNAVFTDYALLKDVIYGINNGMIVQITRGQTGEQSMANVVGVNLTEKNTRVLLNARFDRR